MKKIFALAWLSLTLSIVSAVAQAQPATCANGQIGPYNVHLGTGPCDVASGASFGAFSAQKGSANGLAPLGADSKVPLANLPPLTAQGGLVASNNLSDLPNPAAARVNLGLAPSATTDTTNATNITSGTLAAARLPALNTGMVVEGSNLYFTTGRAAAAAPVQSVAGLTGAPTVAQVSTALAGNDASHLTVGNDPRLCSAAAGTANGCSVVTSGSCIPVPTTTWTVCPPGDASGSLIFVSGSTTVMTLSPTAGLTVGAP